MLALLWPETVFTIPRAVRLQAIAASRSVCVCVCVRVWYDAGKKDKARIGCSSLNEAPTLA